MTPQSENPNGKDYGRRLWFTSVESAWSNRSFTVPLVISSNKKSCSNDGSIDVLTFLDIGIEAEQDKPPFLGDVTDCQRYQT